MGCGFRFETRFFLKSVSATTFNALAMIYTYHAPDLFRIAGGR